MSFTALIILSGATAASELNKVRSSWGGVADTFSMEYALMFGGGLGLILLFLFLARTAQLKKRIKSFKSISTITDQRQIVSVLTLAVKRQADCTLEIFNSDYPNLLRGHLFALTENQRLLMDLANTPPYELNFARQPFQIHFSFRPSAREPMLYFQFTGQTITIEYIREKYWRTARLGLSWPHTLISAQRRRFLRLEPSGLHNLTCQLYYESSGPFIGPETLKPVGTSQVMDISLGGIRVSLNQAVSFRDEAQLIGVLDLPLEKLSLTLKESKVFLILKPVTTDYISRKGSPAEAGEVPPAAKASETIKTMVRLQIIGRYHFEPVVNLWRQQPFSLEKFQDLAYWIQACQRYQIQKEQGILSSDGLERGVSRYPSKPPEKIPYKYEYED